MRVLLLPIVQFWLDEWYRRGVHIVGLNSFDFGENLRDINDDVGFSNSEHHAIFDKFLLLIKWQTRWWIIQSILTSGDDLCRLSLEQANFLLLFISFPFCHSIELITIHAEDSGKLIGTEIRFISSGIDRRWSFCLIAGLWIRNWWTAGRIDVCGHGCTSHCRRRRWWRCDWWNWTQRTTSMTTVLLSEWSNTFWGI